MNVIKITTAVIILNYRYGIYILACVVVKLSLFKLKPRLDVDFSYC